MEAVEDIVIVGAGIAGLTTALGLHRLGLRSLVVEASDGLRTTGFAFLTWTNAWRALDAVGIGEPLRQQHNQLSRFRLQTTSEVSGHPTAERQFDATGPQRGHEFRCVQRRTLLETLVNELPSGTVRYSSKVVSIEESGYSKLVHLSDGSSLKAKVLIGCDGVNSAVTKWLGFKKPAFVGRFSIRGSAYYEHGHGFEPEYFRYNAEGVRLGAIACDEKSIYWFFTFSSSSKSEFRHPWEILLGNIDKTNVCVAGDAFHPMTPDIGQGACSALEDGIVLARCLGEALRDKQGMSSEEEYRRIEIGLKSYAKERRWRAFKLISTAYTVGYIEQSNGKVLSFLRDRVLASFLAGLPLKMASYDCGKLRAS
ncbi:hypothetical protein EUGRSUZ_I01445 [Eucalyptus grandis]|uniref:Uncharacterized protein n=2 Tax=Eucalyptus grandis TaxID=71139 RepID=A0ACC3JFB0_EUCGR|nr:hypothetical protein EUGRSUZ_I01445 [Eucalyptus grandis]